jgi:hypothetical protein
LDNTKALARMNKQWDQQKTRGGKRNEKQDSANSIDSGEMARMSADHLQRTK